MRRFPDGTAHARALRTCLWATAVTLAALAPPAHAESLTYTVPSPRAQAMGGAGVALPGDDPFASILNPAHLADVEGLNWGHSREYLFPGTSGDVRLQSDYITAGAGGVGLSFDGRPFSSLGKTLIDYGALVAYNQSGDSIGVFHASEEVREFGLGLRPYHLARGLGALLGVHLPGVEDYADVALGWRWKRFNLNMGLPVLADSLTGSARDWGVLLRISPYHNIAGEIRGDRELDGGRLRMLGGLAVDLYAGLSYANSYADTLRFYPAEPPRPENRPQEVRRAGLGLVARTGLPTFLQENEAGESPRLARWLGPTLVFAATWEEIQPRGVLAQLYGPSVTHGYGAELTVLDVASLRIGHQRNHRAEINSATWGFGVNLHYGQAVSLRYDWASYELARGLGSSPHIWSWRASMNPYGVLKVLVGE